jgi:methyl-accepting chemotaxis protein
MYVQFSDIAGLIAIFFGVLICLAVFVLLIVALLELIKVLRKINKVVNDNSAAVNKTLTQLPELTENINKASVSIRSGVDKVDASLDSISGLFGEPGKSENVSNTVLSILNVADDILRLVSGFFQKDK